MAEIDYETRLEHFPRLVKVYHLIAGHPAGISAGEIARRCGVNNRTIYRDINELEQAGVPVWEKEHRYGICAGHFLPPISLTGPEAVLVFLSLRLLLGYSQRYSMDMANVFLKLGGIVPETLEKEISRTSAWMAKLPVEPRLNRNLGLLAQAWLNRKQARIVYRSYQAEKPAGRIIEPYYIEPAASGRSCYVIGYCHLKNQVRTFKIERIESVHLLDEGYEIPGDFDANQYLSPSLGIMVTDDDTRRVKMKFSAGLGRIIQESVWHPSQAFCRLDDGSLIMTMDVNVTPELVGWVLGWGERAEVLEPESLRQEIKKRAARLAALYGTAV